MGQTIRRIFGLSAILLMLTLCLGALPGHADISISEPTDGAVVRGQITVRFSGIPAGGYAIIKVDGNFMQATSQNAFALNTFDAQSFGISRSASTEGQHQVSITGVDASGKHTSTDTVSFTVANNKVDVTAPAVKLTHWVPRDVLDNSAQRYRIFAESNAIISSAKAGGGGGMPTGGAMDVGAGMPGGGGAAKSSSAGWIPSPLDWQYTALLRRVVRDVGLYKGSANIKIVIQDAFQRQREDQGGGSAAGGSMLNVGAPQMVNSTGDDAAVNMSGVPAKAPWAETWLPAPESGTYFVKTITPTGEEVNATRKKRSIAITDLLPLFPEEKVQPGSRWETLMTFLSDLSGRQPFNVKAPITFTGFEEITLPSGDVRRAAKLECRFKIDEEHNGEVATKMAAGLAVSGGIASGGQGASGGGMEMVGMGTAKASGGDDAAIKAAEASIASATIRVSRVIWFDVDRHRVLRSQDHLNTFFVMKQAKSTGGTDGMTAPAMLPGMEMPGQAANAAPSAPAEPTTVNYVMNVVTWYDDTVPAPTETYNAGAGTPHSQDNVQEPSISKITGK